MWERNVDRLPLVCVVTRVEPTNFWCMGWPEPPGQGSWWPILSSFCEWCDVCVCIYLFFTRGCPIVLAPFVEMIFPPFCFLSFFIKGQLIVTVWVFFCNLYSVPLIYLSVLSPIPCCLDSCSFGSISPPTLFFSLILCWLFRVSCLIM